MRSRSWHHTFMLSFPRHKDSPWPRRSMRKISQVSFNVVCSTNSDHLEILLATPCSRTITGRGCLGARHRQYLTLSPPATGKLCDTSIPDKFVTNLECSPLVNESRTSSEKVHCRPCMILRQSYFRYGLLSVNNSHSSFALSD